jgi:hypothetical protein
MIDVLKIDTFISSGCFYICCHFHICTTRSDVKRAECETVIRTRYSNDILNLFNQVLQLHGLDNVEWKDEEIGVMTKKAASRKTCPVCIRRFSQKQFFHPRFNYLVAVCLKALSGVQISVSKTVLRRSAKT